jgi:cell division GTPase FtsZ
MPIDDKDIDSLFNEELPSETVEAKEDTMALTLVNEKDRSIKIGVVGVGQAGSRLAEVFYKYGYSVGVLNTALQDLKFIHVPERKKLFLEYGLGGAGKDLAIGEGAINEHRDTIVKFLETEVVADNDMLFLAISGGGGTGSGSVEPLLNVLKGFDRPVGVIYVLPMNTDDAVAKKNSLTTLARLAKMASTDVINTLVVVDNSKIETIYGGLSQTEFWKTANEAIVTPFHLFNSLTSQASEFTSLDPTDFGRIISYGDCSLYGMIEVDNYLDETALAEAVMKGLDAGMLASGFDLKQAKVGGVLVIGSKEVLEKIPANNINYMFHMISEQTDNASVYRGIYAMAGADSVKVYAWFAGLGLPVDRINALKQESVLQAAKQEEKEKNRVGAMTLDVGEKTTTAAQEIHQKIKAKNSAFGKLTGNARGGIVDKRKK